MVSRLEGCSVGLWLAQGEANLGPCDRFSRAVLASISGCQCAPYPVTFCAALLVCVCVLACTTTAMVARDRSGWCPRVRFGRSRTWCGCTKTVTALPHHLIARDWPRSCVRAPMCSHASPPPLEYQANYVCSVSRCMPSGGPFLHQQTRPALILPEGVRSSTGGLVLVLPGVLDTDPLVC